MLNVVRKQVNRYLMLIAGEFVQKTISSYLGTFPQESLFQSFSFDFKQKSTRTSMYITSLVHY